MRIAIFAEFFLPKIDGVVTRTLNTVRCLKKMGDEVLIFTANSELKEYSGASIFGINSINLPLYPEYKMAFPLPIIQNKLEQFNPDVVFVICPLCLGLGGIYYAKQMGCPLVISHNTNWSLYAKFNGMKWLEKPAYKIMSYVYKQATVLVTVSQHTINELNNIVRKPIYLWPTGINSSLLECRKSEKNSIKLTKEDVKKPLMLFVGRLSREKNIPFIAEIMKGMPSANLAIVGDGPERANLEKIFPKNRTVFTGYLQGEELAQCYASADIFLFPSEFETLGNVVLEAMASRCPVVACRAGGVQDIIKHNETGLLFDPEDIEEAIKATQSILFDREKRSRIILNARQYVENYNWENATKTLKKYFNLAINYHQDNH